MHAEGGGGSGSEQALEDLELHALVGQAVAAAHHGDGLGLRRVQPELGCAHALAACARVCMCTCACACAFACMHACMCV